MRKLMVIGFLVFLVAWTAAQTDRSLQGKQPASIDEALATAKLRGQTVLVHFFSPG